MADQEPLRRCLAYPGQVFAGLVEHIEKLVLSCDFERALPRDPPGEPESEAEALAGAFGLRVEFEVSHEDPQQAGRFVLPDEEFPASARHEPPYHRGLPIEFAELPGCEKGLHPAYGQLVTEDRSAFGDTGGNGLSGLLAASQCTHRLLPNLA